MDGKPDLIIRGGTVIDGSGKLLLSANEKEFIQIDKSALSLVSNDSRPLKMINPIKNRSAAIIKLENFENTFLYIISRRKY